jgi:hypothetical protein
LKFLFLYSDYMLLLQNTQKETDQKTNSAVLYQGFYLLYSLGTVAAALYVYYLPNVTVCCVAQHCY